MTEIRLEEKLIVQIYEGFERDEFQSEYARKDDNFKAVLFTWTGGTKVYIFIKRVFFARIVIGFAVVIDCELLNGKEKKVKQLFNIPQKYNELFINDFRIGKPFRRKGFGTIIAKQLLSEKRKYLLEPIEDGKYF